MNVYLHQKEVAILKLLKHNYLTTLSIHQNICLQDTPIEGIIYFETFLNLLEGLYVRGYILKPIDYDANEFCVYNVTLTEKCLNFFNHPSLT